MNTTADVYTLSLSFSPSREKKSDIQTIITAIKTWREKYGPRHVNFLEREEVIGSIFGLVNIYTKNILATLPESLMRQVLSVLWEEFKKDKTYYEVELLL